jgi:hypothetical protein
VSCSLVDPPSKRPEPRARSPVVSADETFCMSPSSRAMLSRNRSLGQIAARTPPLIGTQRADSDASYLGVCSATLHSCIRMISCLLSSIFLYPSRAFMVFLVHVRCTVNCLPILFLTLRRVMSTNHMPVVNLGKRTLSHRRCELVPLLSITLRPECLYRCAAVTWIAPQRMPGVQEMNQVCRIAVVLRHWS